ncbi:flavodoxin domain-containing protein [Kocuria sp.]|uniref:flavodoxin domain-containing protein n=1 Tax=Kocuria sp. TaxID=1871328 RepID=UPI0026E0E15C|nr:flavodoxin domain-containing protein [Kocuria sp.]MDO5619315.1 flavodoxin domain-containing protein [Kocuria sp.]
MTTLVLIASKHGATQDIADRMRQTWEAAGEHVLVEHAENPGDSLTQATRVVVGVPVYKQKLLATGVTFLENHAAQLQDKELFIFASGGSPQLDQKLRDQLQTHTPHEVAYFRGAVDSAKLNLAEKAILKVVKSPLDADWRDWEEISRWARELPTDRTA